MNVLAWDVGGTRIKLGLVRGAKLLARAEVAALPERGLASALRRIARALPALCRRARVAPTALDGVGLAFPGIIEPKTECILSTPQGKFDDARNLDVAGWVRRELGLPARICNDANAALAGEWRYGAARGCQNAVIMTLGTGIGTSAIVEGRPLRGPHGQAGCLGGHWTTNLHGRICPCGNIGCAESEASTWALPILARAGPGIGAGNPAGKGPLDFASVFRAADRGDDGARELRDHCLRVWGMTLVSLIHAYDPECAIVGGGVMQSGASILPALRRHVRRHAWTPWGQVTVKAAALGNDAGLLGSAWLFESQP